MLGVCRRNAAFRSEHAKNGGARTSPAPKRPRSECENSALKTNKLESLLIQLSEADTLDHDVGDAALGPWRAPPI